MCLSNWCVYSVSFFWQRACERTLRFPCVSRLLQIPKPFLSKLKLKAQNLSVSVIVFPWSDPDPLWSFTAYLMLVMAPSLHRCSTFLDAQFLCPSWFCQVFLAHHYISHQSVLVVGATSAPHCSCQGLWGLLGTVFKRPTEQAATSAQLATENKRGNHCFPVLSSIHEELSKCVKLAMDFSVSVSPE